MPAVAAFMSARRRIDEATPTPAAIRFQLPNTISAPFSAIMKVAALVFADVTAGITEASITRRRGRSRSRP